MAARIVSDVEIVELRPKLKSKDPELLALMPTRLFAQRMTFSIGPVADAEANAIRRTIGGELPVRRLYCEYEEIETDDEFIIGEMIIKRLKCVPIDQATPMTATYHLSATNPDLIERDVKMSEFRGGALPFNGTSTLCTLKPGKFMKITVSIRESINYVPGCGMYVLATNTVSLALDVKPINTFEADDDGIPSRLANPRKWQIGFTTNGELPCREIVRRACASISERATAVRSLLYSISRVGDEYILVVPGETHTMGNLFLRTIYDLYPDIGAIVYLCDTAPRQCTLKMRTSEDVNVIFEAAIRHIVDLMGRIGAEIKE